MAGASAITQGSSCLINREHPMPLPWIAGVLMITSGALVLIGFLTPFMSLLAGIGILGVPVPASALNLLNAKPSQILATTIAVSIALLGPGAFSVDARLFGRREIIIPPSSDSPKS
jgi:uncharacterized membrane protein YphA (DoxX/SURF4 family)